MVAALFVRADSVYKGLGVECWDEGRDARSYTGLGPVICHPPCRTWGVMRHWPGAKDRPEEKALGPVAVGLCRAFGGVLEHPYQSGLWRACGMPAPGGVRDAWGGFTLLVDQGWWGHPAPKPTYLYVVGCEPADIPAMPVQVTRAGGRTLNLARSDREATPEPLARWLVALATQLHAPVVQMHTVASYTGQAEGQLHAAAREESIAGGQLHRPRQVRAPEVKAAMGKLAARKRSGFKEWASSL
ncbi:MAG TPA: hypothetical protein VN663_11075 [Ramlibacter sp.]|nr:hypothetical protein [Ramlibacter sp.]